MVINYFVSSISADAEDIVIFGNNFLIVLILLGYFSIYYTIVIFNRTCISLNLSFNTNLPLK